MNEFWPSMRTILTAFFCLHWYYKGTQPFSWWILFIFIIFDFVTVVIMDSILEKAKKR